MHRYGAEVVKIQAQGQGPQKELMIGQLDYRDWKHADRIPARPKQSWEVATCPSLTGRYRIDTYDDDDSPGSDGTNYCRTGTTVYFRV